LTLLKTARHPFSADEGRTPSGPDRDFSTGQGRPQPGLLRLRSKTFDVPSIVDGAVVGKTVSAAVGLVLRLCQSANGGERLVSLPVEDDVIGSILVRESILLKVEPGRIRALVLEKVRPVMTGSEILGLKLDVEVQLLETMTHFG
jgi:hypothetical protein